MKIRGGYSPKIAGRPLSIVTELPLPQTLKINLTRKGLKYRPLVKPGQRVQLGQALAEAPHPGGLLYLPAPAAGKVSLSRLEDEYLLLTDAAEGKPAEPFRSFRSHQPHRISGRVVRQTLARAGIWPFFWSSRTDGVPSLDEQELPRAIIVNSVITEPFRTRGKVILQRSWNRIVQGIRFLPRLLADYGTIEIILTAVHDPVARRMYDDLSGFAWVRLQPVPLTYPIENPRLLSAVLRKAVPSLQKHDLIWVIDIQGVEAVGACLGEGLPLRKRVVVTGGPGWIDAPHLQVRIGTPMKEIMDRPGWRDNSAVLRGGLFTGQRIDPGRDAVHYDDDAFFLLPESQSREFLSFLRPGFNRVSYSPSFVSRLTGVPDRHITASLRGERRPCIACGYCENVCPVRIMPQVLHRYLYRQAFDEAEKAGLELCVDCALCTYICPSKIELHRQFRETRELLRREQQEAAQAGGEPRPEAGEKQG